MYRLVAACAWPAAVASPSQQCSSASPSPTGGSTLHCMHFAAHNTLCAKQNLSKLWDGSNLALLAHSWGQAVSRLPLVHAKLILRYSPESRWRQPLCLQSCRRDSLTLPACSPRLHYSITSPVHCPIASACIADRAAHACTFTACICASHETPHPL